MRTIEHNDSAPLTTWEIDHLAFLLLSIFTFNMFTLILIFTLIFIIFKPLPICMGMTWSQVAQANLK